MSKKVLQIKKSSVYMLYCQRQQVPINPAEVTQFIAKQSCFLHILCRFCAAFFYFLVTMPLLKAQKKELAVSYLQQLQQGRNVAVLSFDKIPVNEVNKIRMNIADVNGSLQVVKKRVFLKATAGTFDGLTLEQANAAVMLLYSFNEEDEYAPLKVIGTTLK